ncbi:hypothetical protein ACLK14_22790 [Escherichia coli]
MLLAGMERRPSELAGDYYVPDFRRVYFGHLPIGHQNAYVLVATTTPQAAISLASRTGWRLPGTVLFRLVWGSPRWCLPPAMTA